MRSICGPICNITPLIVKDNSIFNMPGKPNLKSEKTGNMKSHLYFWQTTDEKIKTSKLANMQLSKFHPNILGSSSLFFFIAKPLEDIIHAKCLHFLTIISLHFFCNMVSFLTQLKWVLTILNEIKDKLLILPNITWNSWSFDSEKLSPSSSNFIVFCDKLSPYISSYITSYCYFTSTQTLTADISHDLIRPFIFCSLSTFRLSDKPCLPY